MTEVEIISMPQLQPPLEGKEFLASSHYRIGYDKRLPKSATKRSLFKKHFGAHEQHEKTKASQPPEPADIMHSDLKFKVPDSTETQDSYQKNILPKIPQCISLTKTNFKMDADKSIDSFHTSYSHQYRAPSVVSRSFPMTNPMKSYVPQGDPQKEVMPVSDYHSKYLGHDTSIFRTIRAPCMHAGGPSTIPGDNRTHKQFSTSVRDQFPGSYLQYVPIKPNMLGSDIPCGDVDKVVHRETTQLSSFPQLDNQHYKRYQRDTACAKIRKTNFKMGHNQDSDNFKTCAMDFFSAKQATKPVEIIVRDSNESSFPKGDRHPDRVKSLVTTTNYGFHHKAPPKGFRNPIICGADKRTASNVTFGEPSRSHEFYSTSQSEAFNPIKAPIIRASGHPSSKVPLDYYADGNYITTTVSEFPHWEDVPKHIVKSEDLAKLRQCNVNQPLHDKRFFDTTNLSTYTAKCAEQFTYDSGSLQKSSVPLGTMTEKEDAIH